MMDLAGETGGPPKAKRVVMVLPHLGVGGAQRVASCMAAHLAAAGNDVTVITTLAKTADFYHLPAGVRRIVLGKQARRVGPAGASLRHWLSAATRFIAGWFGFVPKSITGWLSYGTAASRSAARQLAPVPSMRWLDRLDSVPVRSIARSWLRQELGAVESVAGKGSATFMRRVGWLAVLPAAYLSLVVFVALRAAFRLLRRVCKVSVWLARRVFRFAWRLVTRPLKMARRAVKRARERMKRWLGRNPAEALLVWCTTRRAFGESGRPYAFLVRRTHWRARAIRRHLVETEPDVVLSLLGSANILTVSASFGLPHKVVVSERNDPGKQRLSSPWQELRPILYPVAHVVSANSTGALDAMRSFCPSEKLVYLPNPLVLNGGADESARSSSFLFLGRLVHQKAPDVLLDAFARFARSVPRWRLHFAGDGPMAEELQALARELRVEARVIFHGMVENPGKLLSRCNVFVLPSRFEGTPNALMEAMAHRMACIVSDASPGPLRLIEHGHSGIVVRTDCSESLASAMQQMVASPGLRMRMADAAFERVQEFGLDAVAVAWDRVLFAEQPRPSAGWVRRAAVGQVGQTAQFST
jgi:glycosyltransferase involved in cell wall biosynthesis